MKKYVELDALSLNEDGFVELGLRTVEICNIPTKNVILVGRKNTERKSANESMPSFKVASNDEAHREQEIAEDS